MEINILGMSDARWIGAGRSESGQHTLIHSREDNHERKIGIICDEDAT